MGMVTSIAAPDRFGRLSETAFVTPSETLFSIYPEIVASDVRPYMGLAAFTEKDAEFFFGRRRFLLVTGPSGSGKSSVVQAGLIPRQGLHMFGRRTAGPGAGGLSRGEWEGNRNNERVGLSDFHSAYQTKSI